MHAGTCRIGLKRGIVRSHFGSYRLYRGEPVNGDDRDRILIKIWPTMVTASLSRSAPYLIKGLAEAGDISYKQPTPPGIRKLQCKKYVAAAELGAIT